VSNITTSLYNDTQVTPAMNYFYCVKAAGPNGESTFSNSDRGFALGHVTNLNATDGGFNATLLTFTASSGLLELAPL
jgi:hypothetical protein